MEWYRPGGMEEGADVARRVRKALASLNAQFRVIEIDPAFTHTAAFCGRYGYPLEQAANAILVSSRRPAGRNAVCVAQAVTRLDVNRRVRELLGVRKLSFAPAEAARELTGMMTGGVTPFGLPDGLAVYVDSRVMELDEILVGGGDRSSKVFVDPEVFARMSQVTVVEELAVPIPGGPGDGPA